MSEQLALDLRPAPPQRHTMVTDTLEQTGPAVPWTSSRSSRAIEELRLELGGRAAHDIIVRPFLGWHGAHGYTEPANDRPRYRD